uniref:Phosducin n=1 Tax=Gopherus evgoodei TaxID=1825980 RepID=A0A8C4YLI6_9SAUR
NAKRPHQRSLVVLKGEWPKGVINDWRKFKLESEDRDSLPLSKKEILRQMSSPHRSLSKDDKDTRERFSHLLQSCQMKTRDEILTLLKPLAKLQLTLVEPGFHPMCPC